VAELISIARARALVLETVQPLDADEVELDAALGRVLAEDVESAIDVPPFDNSAMDGYAIAGTGDTQLAVIDESRAGSPAAAALAENTAIRVSTGAALPRGTSAVVAVEHAVADAPTPGDTGSGVVHVGAVRQGENIRRAGEDVRAGDVVLHRGALIGPAELGVAAAVGRRRLLCARRPRVAVLVTGDELTEPGEPLGPGRIYSSNAYALSALVQRAGAELVARETVADSAEATRRAFERALEAADVLCVSGGVSVGPHDHVKGALAELGVEELFWGVRLRPGKPTWFGTRGRSSVFGLPGNPVSAMVTFLLFVRPALAALQGAPTEATRVRAVLDEAVARHPTREQAVRVGLTAAQDGWHAITTGAQGSHMLTSMLGADGLALVAAGEGELPRGASVEVELL
jgi:molybdopterin molybdotransferase